VFEGIERHRGLHVDRRNQAIKKASAYAVARTYSSFSGSAMALRIAPYTNPNSVSLTSMSARCRWKAGTSCHRHDLILVVVSGCARFRAVKKITVGRIERTLERLHEVDVVDGLAHGKVPCGQIHPGEARQGRRIAGPHVDPEKAASLCAGVAFAMDATAHTAVLGLARHLAHMPGHVHFPAVVNATKAVALITGKHE